MPLILAAVVAAAAAPAVHVLELRGAIAFGLALSAWLLFGRLIVWAVFAYLLNRLTSPVIAYAICSAITDAPAVLFAIALDRRLIWGALAAVAVAEAIFWTITRPWKSPPDL